MIDRNEIYISTDAIYLESNVPNKFEFTQIINNLFVNAENSITFKSPSYYEFLFIVGNTIFKPKNYFLNFQNFK